MKSNRNAPRSKSGNLLIIIILVVNFVVIPILLFLFQMGLYLADRDRAQYVVDAASILAADDLSGVIVNDPSFGWVSLSNYPPVGEATCAPDGEPLPVIGINTLVGTIRQNAIVARELRNETMASLADDDRDALQGTIRELNGTLQNSLGKDQKKLGTNIHGVKVDPVTDAKKFLMSNLPNNFRLETIKLTNGWIDEGGSTTIPIPQPEHLAQLKPGTTLNGKYKPFVNIPVEKESFTFGAIGSSSTLVNSTHFREADGNHICSIVKVECTFSRVAPGLDLLKAIGFENLSKLQTTACCQPYTLADNGPLGVMTLRFSAGAISGLDSWASFLGNNFQDKKITTYDVVGGDYPTDVQARMSESQPRLQASTSQQFSEHLYYWLRNGHLRPRIDAVLSMVNEPFRNGPKEVYAYEFATNGTISRRVLSRDPFPVGVTCESQLHSVVDTSIHNGMSPIIVFRNNVKNLGTALGGKHAGQPLPGYPLNWCELPDFGGDEQMALRLGKGHLATGLTIADPFGQSLKISANDPTNTLFRNGKGNSIAMQPRRSYYSGGLALDIEIGGAGEPAATAEVAAARDLLSMRRLRFTRRI